MEEADLLNGLPSDVLEGIVAHLPLRSVASLIATCKRMHDVLLDSGVRFTCGRC